MAKKATGASAKMMKNVVKKRLAHGLNKVARPKVYITDSSSFKALVQRLTGNQAAVPSFEEEAADRVLPVTAVECGSQRCSSNSFVDSVEEACSQLLLSPSDQETEHTSSAADLDSLISECMSTDQAVSPGYSDIDSWLLGVEHELLNIGIPDYELSAALMAELF